ncbi:MAG: DUF1998 domain-containing protein [Bacteroidota bacterium]
MAIKQLSENKQANESISKFKLLSAYGGPGSLIHTQYGSIIISCIEEWGFIKKILEIETEGLSLGKNEDELKEYVLTQAKLARNGNIGISNDSRLLKELKERKSLSNLKYLTLIPTIEVKNYNNELKGDAEFTVPSTYFPKVFSDKLKLHKTYKEWFSDWITNNPTDNYGKNFSPPKKYWNELLTQDNIVLICNNGHISDFPWSKFLNWRTENRLGIEKKETVDLFRYNPCCGTDDKPTSQIKITSSSANASGFDGKWIKCDNCKKQTSLKGLMSVKIKCIGHLPWETTTGNKDFHSGDREARKKDSPKEVCVSANSMKVALTTGNNLYFSRLISSIFMPDELFESTLKLEIKKLEIEKQVAKYEDRLEDAIEINKKIKLLLSNQDDSSEEIILDSEKEIYFRYQEFNALRNKSTTEINKEEKYLQVKDVTEILDENLNKYFSRILRIDNMKITSAELDFSRVEPADIDSNVSASKNIFRSQPANVQVYPVVENYGEGIFIAFNEEYIGEYIKTKTFIDDFNSKLGKLEKQSSNFSSNSINYAISNNWQLYVIHTFSHILMRELEFRCGYPTASLSERIYVSNNPKTQMYGVMIYTAEGAEGSMGGLIAQTRTGNLNNLIKSALKRSTICHSDPLCWESEGQGLFDLNFASCFSCSLVSETSCELRNIYLDRRMLVDEENGFFKDIINEL